MSGVTAAGGAGKERQKRSTCAAVMRATSMRDGAFSNRRPADGELEQRIRAKRVAVVGVLVPTRDPEHAKAELNYPIEVHRRRHARRLQTRPDELFAWT